MPKPFLYLLPKPSPKRPVFKLSMTVKSFEKALVDLPEPDRSKEPHAGLFRTMLCCTLDALHQIIARDGDIPIQPKFDAFVWRVEILEREGESQ